MLDELNDFGRALRRHYFFAFGNRDDKAFEDLRRKREIKEKELFLGTRLPVLIKAEWESVLEL